MGCCNSIPEYEKPQQNDNDDDINDAFLIDENTPLTTKLHYGLQHIEMKNKLLVIGYCRQVIMKKHKMYIPSGIINYCIVYTYLFHDKFDSQNIGTYHTLNGNVITCINQHYTYSSSFLTNTVINGEQGTGTWRFKIKSKDCGNIMLGIWKTKSGRRAPTNIRFWMNNNGYGYKVGYGQDHKYKHYGICCKQNDIILMSLDMNNLTLSFKVNNTDYGILSKVDKANYKAAVYMGRNGQSCEFISY
eukprot:182151_1